MAHLKIIPCLAKYKDEVTVPVARVRGIINSETLIKFKEYLDNITDKKPKRFIFDFNKVDYINSSGIGELIRLSDNFDEYGGTFVITHPSHEVTNLIRLLGLENLLPVLPKTKHAILLFTKGHFKNSTIAVINQQLRHKLEPSAAHEVKNVPMKPLGNYTLLMVPSKGFFYKFLNKRLTGKKGKLKLAKNISQARRRIKKSLPDMLIVDDCIEENKKLLSDLKSDMKTNRTRIIKMLRHNTDKHVSQFTDSGVYISEDETIQEPFDYNELLALAGKEYQRYRKNKKIVRHSTKLHILSSEDAIKEANSLIYDFIARTSLSRDDVTSFHLAVKEAIDNAYRHGNLKVKDRTIKINFLMDTLKITVSVGDEGNGFDHKYYLDAAKRLSPEQSARKRHEEDKTGGLGIIMMKKSSDKIFYNDIGNQVTLQKYIQKSDN